MDRATRAPAQDYGIYPQKGTIAVGSDAGPGRRRSRSGAGRAGRGIAGDVGFLAVEGNKLRGWPVATVKGGEIVARDGKIVGKPTGRYLLREAKPAAPDLEWLRRAA